MLTILGPTATGKTTLAAHVADLLNGEILSADSRQVYRNMNIGTGKDLDDYFIGEKKVPYHLIDLVEAGYQYNVFEFQRDFLEAFGKLKERDVFPVFCGGSGLYLEAVLKGYKMTQVPSDSERRKELELLSLQQLTELLYSYKTVHNNSDTETKKRAVRAIEIEEYIQKHPELDFSFPAINSLIIGIDLDRNTRRERITRRLRERLNSGMVQEVKSLLDSGLKADELTYYGLEYKFVTLYLTGELSYDEMENRLNIAIHQFAKRQMTWFRKMEKEGFNIHWIDGTLPMEEKVDIIIKKLNVN